MPGLLSFWNLTGSVLRDQRCLTYVEQVVDAHLEELLIRMKGSSSTGVARKLVVISIAASDGKFLRAEPQVVVFEFEGPILGEGMFNTNTEKKTV